MRYSIRILSESGGKKPAQRAKKLKRRGDGGEKDTYKCHSWGLWWRSKEGPHVWSWQQGQGWGRIHPLGAYCLVVWWAVQVVQWKHGERKKIWGSEKGVFEVKEIGFGEGLICLWIWIGLRGKVGGWEGEKPWLWVILNGFVAKDIISFSFVSLCVRKKRNLCVFEREDGFVFVWVWCCKLRLLLISKFALKFVASNVAMKFRWIQMLPILGFHPRIL